MTTLLMTSPEEFIPFFAIFFTFMVPILGMYFYYQNKNKILDERKLMIEKGMTPPPIVEQREHFQNKSSFSKGINLIAIALGLLVGYFISKYAGIHFPFSIAGSILFFLGLANIINAITSDNQNNSTKS